MKGQVRYQKHDLTRIVTLAVPSGEARPAQRRPEDDGRQHRGDQRSALAGQAEDVGETGGERATGARDHARRRESVAR